MSAPREEAEVLGSCRGWQGGIAAFPPGEDAGGGGGDGNSTKPTEEAEVVTVAGP